MILTQDDKVKNVEDAVDLHMTSEVLEGYTANNRDVHASKQTTIERLPRVLLLHLKRFDFGLFGSEKVTKPVPFSPTLKIKPNWLSFEKQYSPTQRTYSLHAVINHIGQRAIGGHYTCDIRQNDNTWLRHDDATVSPVSTDTVFNNQAYVLMYIMNSENTK